MKSGWAEQAGDHRRAGEAALYPPVLRLVTAPTRVTASTTDSGHNRQVGEEPSVIDDAPERSGNNPQCTEGACARQCWAGPVR